MRTFIFSTLLLGFSLSSCQESNSKTETTTSNVNTYSKKPLPPDFTYAVVKDNSNEALEKNDLDIEINKKLTVEQIATLADKIYDSKPTQRRFYIFYFLEKYKKGAHAWAISHFDPTLKIEILGSSLQEDSISGKIVANFKGDVLGKWYEKNYRSSTYILYRVNSKKFMKTVFKDGEEMDEELIEKKVPTGIRLEPKEKTNGEYYVLGKNNILEFYDEENKKFTTAAKL
ncbi:MAG: hypothetical protein JST83_00605 [Bacteroidetes bacterium]|nr:hypothetical protein [Bacteroidota bacterium]